MPGAPTAGRVMRDDVVRCRPTDRAADVRESIERSPYPFALITSDERHRFSAEHRPARWTRASDARSGMSRSPARRPSVPTSPPRTSLGAGRQGPSLGDRDHARGSGLGRRVARGPRARRRPRVTRHSRGAIRPSSRVIGASGLSIASHAAANESGGTPRIAALRHQRSTPTGS